MSAAATDDSLCLTVSEFCSSARIARSTFDQLRKEGRAPPSIRFGKRRLIRREAAEAWLRDLERA